MRPAKTRSANQATRPDQAAGAGARDVMELTMALSARDNFIAIAAHELRNPMTPMLGQIELLLHGVKSRRYSHEQIEERLATIHGLMSHYIKRAATLLDLSRMASGKRALDWTQCDLTEIVRQVTDTFGPAARHAGVTIDVQAPASLSGLWDRTGLEQIVDNLVSNAIKYGGRNPVVVSVALSADGSQAVLRVRDHGPGISEADRGRIFGRFERAVGASDKRSGFGIGLWVVGQMVHAMKGDIVVDTAQGGGAVFQVTLPRGLDAEGRQGAADA